MSVWLTSPLGQKGDIKLLGSGYGSYFLGDFGWISIGSFMLPALTGKERILLDIDIYCDNAGDIVGVGFGKTQDATPGATAPCFKQIKLQRVWAIAEVSPDVFGASYINHRTSIYPGATTTMSIDSTAWNNTGAAQTIYANVLFGELGTITYRWSAYLIGDGVK